MTFPVKQRRSTLAALFQAYEEDDIEKLKQLTAGIKTFDRLAMPSLAME